MPTSYKLRGEYTYLDIYIQIIWNTIRLQKGTNMIFDVLWCKVLLRQRIITAGLLSYKVTAKVFRLDFRIEKVECSIDFKFTFIVTVTISRRLRHEKYVQTFKKRNLWHLLYQTLVLTVNFVAASWRSQSKDYAKQRKTAMDSLFWFVRFRFRQVSKTTDVLILDASRKSVFYVLLWVVARGDSKSLRLMHSRLL